jgi:hypothetical protein
MNLAIVYVLSLLQIITAVQLAEVDSDGSLSLASKRVQALQGGPKGTADTHAADDTSRHLSPENTASSQKRPRNAPYMYVRACFWYIVLSICFFEIDKYLPYLYIILD